MKCKKKQSVVGRKQVGRKLMVGIFFLTRGAIVFKSGLKRKSSDVMVQQLSTPPCRLQSVFCLLFFLLFPSAAFPSDAEMALAEMQQRYSSVDTISGSFTLTTYQIADIEQVESGVFWLKKPALMRWEFSYPEEQLFIADGKKGFIYNPQDNQVTEQSLTTEELLDTPLNFLFGTGDIEKDFVIALEAESETKSEGTQIIRLIPRSEMDYTFLILEIDTETADLVRLDIQQQDGTMQEYLFADLKLNVKVSKNMFKFKPPKGADVHRMERLE